MVLKTKGLVLNQRNIGEQDKIITILSKDFGIIEATVRNVKRNKQNNIIAISAYLEFALFKGKSNYIVNSAEQIESFYNLRLDVTKLALSAYFCELTSSLTVSNENAWDYLRLLLNTLYYLTNSKRSNNLLKSIYELRVLSMAGFMPDLVCCKRCNEYEKDKMYFFANEGYLLCGDCLEPLDKNGIDLSKPVLTAMRHIIYSDLEKLFLINITGNSLKFLNALTEYYVNIHSDKIFKSLEMYKQLSET